jgi:surface protein
MTFIRHPSGKTTEINKCSDVETLYDEVCLKCDIERYNVKLVNSNSIEIKSSSPPEHITEVIYLIILAPFVYSLDGKPKKIDYTKGILTFNAKKITVYQWGNYIYKGGNFSLHNKYREIVILAKDTPCFTSINSLKECFYNTKVEGDLSQWDISGIKNMSWMFACSKIDTDIGLSEWDVSGITNMRGMFMESKISSSIGLAEWNVSNVKDMSYMFRGSNFNQDISKWDVSSVIDMYCMFCLSNFDQDISQWNVSKVFNMIGMFDKSKFNQDISQWDVSNVKNMSYMFRESKFNQDISKWNVSETTLINDMCSDSELKIDLYGWYIARTKS